MGTIEKSYEAGLHSEQLRGRTQQTFFSATEEENLIYPYNGFEVDTGRKAEFEAQDLESTEINLKIRILEKILYLLKNLLLNLTYKTRRKEIKLSSPSKQEQL